MQDVQGRDIRNKGDGGEGAPAIGVSAAFGVALAHLAGEDTARAADEIKASRPTAVNLFWAVDRAMNSESP